MFVFTTTFIKDIQPDAHSSKHKCHCALSKVYITGFSLKLFLNVVFFEIYNIYILLLLLLYLWYLFIFIILLQQMSL